MTKKTLRLQLFVIPVQLFVIPVQLFVIPVQLFVIPVQLFVIPAKAGIRTEPKHLRCALDETMVKAAFDTHAYVKKLRISDATRSGMACAGTTSTPPCCALTWAWLSV
ncbi:MAG: hypothetical protein HQL77_14885 [Magnetococcales bacterium]|nr:hypothetical protein [Magnetococcales bacterium]